MYTKYRDSAEIDEKVTNWANWRIQQWRIRQILLYSFLERRRKSNNALLRA